MPIKINLLLFVLFFVEPIYAQHVKFTRKNVAWSHKIKTGKTVLVKTKDDPTFFYSKAILDSASTTHLYLQNPNNKTQIISLPYNQIVKLKRPRAKWHQSLLLGANLFMGFGILATFKEEPSAVFVFATYIALINFAGPKRNFKTENFYIEYVPQ